MKMLTDFGYDVGPAMQTTARVFGVSVDDIPVWKPGGEDPWNPSGETPWTPSGKTPWDPSGKTPWEPSGKDPWMPSGKLPWNPSGKTPWDPSGDIPWSGGGVFGGSSPSSMAVNMKPHCPVPGDEQSSSKQAAGPPLENSREDGSPEKWMSRLKITTASEVTPVEDPTGPFSATEGEVARKMAPPTREQVEAYLKAAHLGLVQAALQYYSLEDVAAASEEVFSDVSRDEVWDYMKIIVEE
ncbi:hypothetical protein O1611_g1082 [Lasiodiplodia mahajangana]|uniref:Uncharacterized protein n=1 Tax=Lasiodiplodia mahajangana TaxID=1108764 RepID=A0ACC2JYF3_9PEZI|nr:hypothetical protein O1611_g1082 [Lasiodiplodia mahajangana]